MKKHIDKYTVWLIIVIGIFFIPLAQDAFRIFPIEDLKGRLVEVKRKNWSIESWFSGDFQKNQEEYVQANFNIRNFLIRLNNQFNYSFFGKASSPNYFIGKDNYLLSEDVLYKYLGDGAELEDSVRIELEKLKFVQDTLAKLNKHLVFVIAPAKASNYLDKMPASRLREKKINNYDLFVKYFKALNINCIDYNDWFKQIKKDSTFPLFSPKGVHWSIYSATCVIDSMVHYIEFHEKTKLATYKWSKTKLLDAHGSDVDIENVFNLMLPIECPKLPYRTIEIQKRNNDSLKVLAIGDSYYGELFSHGLKNVLPPTNEFWFYGRVSKSLDSNTNNDLHFYQLDLKKKVNDADVIMILYNEANLGYVSYLMIDRLYRLFTNQSLMLPMDEQFFEYVKQRRKMLQEDDDMMREIKEKALFRKISVDSMLQVEAIFSVEYDIWNRKISLNR